MLPFIRTLVDHPKPKYRLTRRFRLIRQRFLVAVMTGTFILYYLIFRGCSSSFNGVFTSTMDLPLFMRDVAADQDEYNIFQLETHGKGDDFSLRTICSFESFCKNNPSATVWMLFIDTQTVPVLKLQIFLSLAQTYPNLRLARFNMEMLLADTPLAKTLSKDRFINSQNLIYDLSDMARVALLYKVGGFYTDFDVINLRDITSFTNFFTYQCDNILNNRIFHMEAGHPILKVLMEEINSAEVDGDTEWDSIGPKLLTRVVKDQCGDFPRWNPMESPKFQKILLGGPTTKNLPMEDKAELASSVVTASDQGDTKAECRGVSKLHKSAFSPLTWMDSKSYFTAKSEQDFKKILMESLGVHVYHDVTYKYTIESGSAYDTMAYTFCPRVHSTAYRAEMQL